MLLYIFRIAVVVALSSIFYIISANKDMASLQTKLKLLRRSEIISCDVQFEVLDGYNDIKCQEAEESDKSDAMMIGAHKHVLALGSPVFKMQFYGPLREDRRVIRIVDSIPEVFRVFIKCFYEDVDLNQLNIKILCDLYYLGDKYCIEELKVRFMVLITLFVCINALSRKA